MPKKKYKVTVEYRGRVTVEVEAGSEVEAERLAVKDADEGINGNLSVYDLTVREAK